MLQGDRKDRLCSSKQRVTMCPPMSVQKRTSVFEEWSNNSVHDRPHKILTATFDTLDFLFIIPFLFVKFL